MENAINEILEKELDKLRIIYIYIYIYIVSYMTFLFHDKQM